MIYSANSMSNILRFVVVVGLVFFATHVIVGMNRCLNGDCPRYSLDQSVREYEDDDGVRHIVFGERDFTKDEWDKYVEIDDGDETPIAAAVTSVAAATQLIAPPTTKISSKKKLGKLKRSKPFNKRKH